MTYSENDSSDLLPIEQTARRQYRYMTNDRRADLRGGTDTAGGISNFCYLRRDLRFFCPVKVHFSILPGVRLYTLRSDDTV